MATPPSSLPLPLADPHARRAFTLHSRLWQSNRYVYPVVSRRSKGISLGINLNPDKLCNFDCIYCSVDRSIPPASGAAAPPPSRDIDLSRLREELAAMLELVGCGGLYQFDPFDHIPAQLRRLNDIAFSGDGEPTTCPQFNAAVRLAAELSDNIPGERSALPKLVLITNATRFHRPEIRETLAFLDAHRGEVWAKLDAGTAGYYELVDRSAVAFDRILENLAWSCRTRPTVIQSLLMNVHGVPPPPAEIAAYVQRLAELPPSPGIKLVQLYTVARQTTEAFATPLAAAALEEIARQVRLGIPHVPVEVYP
jgi:wyosine [tRNA(Phe)-imidazoG37] synthetase (radical SAM superfamily)